MVGVTQLNYDGTRGSMRIKMVIFDSDMLGSGLNFWSIGKFHAAFGVFIRSKLRTKSAPIGRHQQLLKGSKGEETTEQIKKT
jgi:hypothetical protein